MTRVPIAALACILLAACGPAPRQAIDPALARCLPGDTLVLGGSDLDSLRASPLFPKLPPPVLALAEPFGRASYLLAAFNGQDLLLAARGDFRGTPPPGATLVAPNIALGGSPGAVRAATAQFRGRGPQLTLLVPAETIARGHGIWVVARGGAALPLTGNARNVNRLLDLADSTAIGASLQTEAALDLTAVCRSADAGRGFEESLRAILSLTAAGLRAHQPQLAALLDSANVQRQDRTVRAQLSADPEAAARLLGLLSR